MILPKTNLGIPGSVTTIPFASHEEHQYFGLFRRRTSLEILPGLDTGSTRQILLQCFHLNESIKHAIIAIGALDKKNSVVSRFQTLSSVSSDCVKDANKHHQTALKQYAKAIRHMSTAMSSKTVDPSSTLLISLLIICFEAWSGNMQLAVAQVQVGIKLILENKARYDRSDARQSAAESDLIQIFCRLAVQTSFLGFKLSAPCRALLATEGRSLVQKMPAVFHSLQEAATYQQGLVWRGTHFFSIHSAYNPAFERHAISTEVLSEQSELQADTLKWLQAFESLERTMAPPGCGGQFARLMKSQMTVAYAYGAALLADESSHDKCDAYYAEAVNLAEEVLASKYLTKNNESARDGFDMRVIMLLWMAGFDCQNERTRSKAIELLSKYPRREGMWDSVCTGTILQWVAELEGRFRGANGYVPDWARIEGLRWASDFEKRTTLLSCRQRVSGSWSGFAEKAKHISW